MYYIGNSLLGYFSDDNHSKKKKGKVKHGPTPYDNMWVSQLLSQREKIKTVNNFPLASSAAEMLKLQASRNLQWNQPDKMRPDNPFSNPNFNDSPLSCQLAAMAQEKQQGVFQKASPNMNLHQANPNHSYKFNSVLPTNMSKFPNHVMKSEHNATEGLNPNLPSLNPAMWHNPAAHMAQNVPGLATSHGNHIPPSLHSPGSLEANLQFKQYQQNMSPEQMPNAIMNTEGPSKPKKRKVKKERRKVNNLLEQKRGAPCPNVNVRNLQGDSCIPPEASLSSSDNAAKSTPDTTIKEENSESPTVDSRTVEATQPQGDPNNSENSELGASVNVSITDQPVCRTGPDEVSSRATSVASIKSENSGNETQIKPSFTDTPLPTSHNINTSVAISSTPNSVISTAEVHTSSQSTALIQSRPQQPGEVGGTSYANSHVPPSSGVMQFPASTLLSAAARAQGEARSHPGFTGNPHFQQDQVAAQPTETVQNHQGQPFGHHPALRYPGPNMAVQMFPGHMQQVQGQNQINTQTISGQFQGMSSPQSNPYMNQQIPNPRMMAQQWFGARPPVMRPPQWGVHPPTPSPQQGAPTATVTGSHVEPSPIQKVQSMVHGLEVAQQAIEAAQAHRHERGYQRSSSVSSGRSSTRPPSKGSLGGTTPVPGPRMTPQRPLMSPPVPALHMKSPTAHPPTSLPSTSPKEDTQKSNEYNPYDFPSNDPEEEECKEDTKDSVTQQESPDSGIPRTPQPPEDKDVATSDGDQEMGNVPDEEQSEKPEEEQAEPKDIRCSPEGEMEKTNINSGEVQDTSVHSEADVKNTSSESEIKDLNSEMGQKDESFSSKGDAEDGNQVIDHPVSETSTSTVGSVVDNQSNASTNSTPSKSPSAKVSPSKVTKPKRKRDRSKKAKAAAAAAAAANTANTSPQGHGINPYGVSHHMYGPQGPSQRWPNMVQQQHGPQAQFYPQQMQQAVQGQIPYAAGQMPYGSQANMQMQYTNMQQMNIMQAQGQFPYGQSQNPQIQGVAPANFDPSTYPYHQLNMNQMQQMVAAQNMQMQMSPGHAGAGMVQQQQWGMMANQMQGHAQMYPGGGNMASSQQGVNAVQGYNNQGAMAPPQTAEQMNMQAMQAQQQIQGDTSGNIPVQAANPHQMHHHNPRNMENFVMSPTSSDYGGQYGFGCELPSPCKLTRAVNAVVQSQDFDQSGLDFPSITEEQPLAHITSGVDQPASMDNSTDCSLTPASCAMNNSGEYAGSATYSDAEVARRSSMSDSAYSETENTVSCSHQSLPPHSENSEPSAQTTSKAHNNSTEREDEHEDVREEENSMIVRNGPTSRITSDSDCTPQHDSAVTDVYNFEDHDEESDIPLPSNNSDQENEVMNSQIGHHHPLKPGKLPPPSELLPKLTTKLQADTG